MPVSTEAPAARVDLANILDAGHQAFPDQPALLTVDRSWTWRELEKVSNRVAKHLLALGLSPGDRVASLVPNRAALLIHYLACFKAGLVAMPLNYRYLAPSIEHALEVSQAAALFIHGERLAELADSQIARGLRRGWITYQADARTTHRRFEDLAAHDAPDVSLPATNLGDPAMILFTSGSTGAPRGVTHSYETLGWMFAGAAKGFAYTRNDVVLPGSSLSHLGGIVFSLAALAIGARVVVARTFDGNEILPLLREHRPTVLCMLPAALMMLLRDHGATRADYSSLRLCQAGGDKVPAEFEKEFTALTDRVIDEGYGMTEVGHAAMTPPSGRIKEGSIGLPTPGFTFSIRDNNGAEVAVGHEGQLFIRSPSQMIGYWAAPEATAAVLRDGWIDSGDVMAADADGYHWFRGRKKQIIVHDSSNICPQEVEDALGEHPSVAFAGAVGIHDLVHGENVRAYVTFKEGEPVPAIPDLIRFARERIGYKAPEEIVVLEAMPFTATGKVNRTALKQMADDGTHQLP